MMKLRQKEKEGRGRPGNVWCIPVTPFSFDAACSEKKGGEIRYHIMAKLIDR